jgi:hypothetical protein
MRAIVFAALLVSAASARGQDGGVVEGGPRPDSPAAVFVDGGVRAGDVSVADPALPDLPEMNSYSTSSSFAGRVGFATTFVDVEPYVMRTGYGELFAVGDWESIGGSGVGLHFDVDARANVWENRTPCALARNDEGVATGAYVLNGTACDFAPFENDLAANFYENAGVVPTGRYADFLAIDRLSVSWASDFMKVDVGRTRIPNAAQAQVDGVDLSFSLGSIGRVGGFGGLKPNPWHAQVVGAVSGGTVPVQGGEYPSTTWGTLQANAPFLWGANGNELVDVGGAPWLRVFSTRFLTAGLYSALRLGPATADVALAGDLFDYTNLDRVYAYTSGAVRLIEGMTVAWRTHLDVVGARPLLPSQAYLDWTWRDLGPVTLSASWFKVNTSATAVSYARFFAPLEDPQGLVGDDAQLAGHPAVGGDAARLQAIKDVVAARGLDNARIYVVDRDRFVAEAAVVIGPSLQLYGEGIFERRADDLYAVRDLATGIAGVGAGYGEYAKLFDCAPAAADPSAPQNNPVFQGWRDPCKLGGTLGIRDPFLGGAGSFDVGLTYLNGHLSSTTRLGGRLGVSATQRLWLEVGGALELNEAERVYVGDNLGGEVRPDPPFATRAMNVYLVDGSAMLTIWEGISVEGAYLAFFEDLPFQGETGSNGVPPFVRRDPRQLYQTLMGRAVWRF